jgi:hypothetical protein
MLCFNNAALFAALKKPTLLRRHGRVNEARTASSGTRRRYGACSPARLDPPRRASTSTVLTHMPGRPSPRRRGSVWHPLPGFRQPRVQFRGAAESPRKRPAKNALELGRATSLDRQWVLHRDDARRGQGFSCLAPGVASGHRPPRLAADVLVACAGRVPCPALPREAVDRPGACLGAAGDGGSCCRPRAGLASRSCRRRAGGAVRRSGL